MRLQSAILFLLACTGFVSSYYIKPGPLVIATKGEVWPKPQNQKRGEGYMVVRPPVFKFEPTKEYCKLLQEAFDRYKKVIIQTTTLGRRRPKTSTEPRRYKTWIKDSDFKGYLDTLYVQLDTPCTGEDIPDKDMDETYELDINILEKESGVLKAKSIWGAMRGLETFSQLLVLCDDGVALTVNSTRIEDFPRFHHRGLLLDTARHFMPMFTILQIIEAMEYNKLNVFHWHIVDDQSFPYQSLKFPELSQQGAYNPEFMVYTPSDVQKVIRHAAKRGIRVMVEFDTPGHTRSWGVAKPELLTTCYKNSEPDGYLGPIDPTKNTTYEFMREFFQEIHEVFPENYIHLGGDEVGFECWKSNADINRFMQARNITGNYAALEEVYIQKLVDIVNDLQASSVVWEEVFQNGVKLPKETIVHVWYNNANLINATKAGFRTIWSTCWYLDHLLTGGDWTKFYLCDPYTSFHLDPEQEKLVIGGEACMWAESVDATNVVSRIWPRASAVAEKLWSAKNADTTKNAAKRLEEHTCRMNIRGIPAQPPNGPGFCL